MSVITDWGKDSGQRHGGAHRDGKRAFAEDEFFGVHQIRGNAREGYGEVVEAANLRIGERNAIKDGNDLLSGVETLRELQSLLDAELHMIGIVQGVLLSP